MKTAAFCLALLLGDAQGFVAPVPSAVSLSSKPCDIIPIPTISCPSPPLLQVRLPACLID